MKNFLVLLLIFTLDASVAQKRKHDVWNRDKAQQLHLWPEELEFVVENDEIGQRYSRAKPTFIKDGWIYLHDLDKNSVFKFTYQQFIKNYDVAPQLHSHFDNLPIVERILSPEFILKHPQLLPNETKVLINGSSTKWTHGHNQYIGLETDIIRTKISNGFSYLDREDIFHIELTDGLILKGYRLTKKGKRKEGFYYAPYTDFQSRIRQNFQRMWRYKLAPFKEPVSYEKALNPPNINNFQYLIINPEARTLEIYGFGYNGDKTNAIRVLSDVSFEMIDVFFPEPYRVLQKRDDPSFGTPLVINDYFYKYYQMPIPKDWFINDSTFVIERNLKNWYTPPPPLSMDPPIIHPTEKWALFQIPEHWSIKEANSSSELFYGETDHYITMYDFPTTDTLQTSITIVIRDYPVTPPIIIDDEPEIEIDSLTTEEVFVLENVKFKARTTIMLSGGHQDLLKLANYLKSNPNLNVELRGHTDERGNEQANIELSEDRVAYVIDELKQYGIKKKRIFGKGYGSSDPIDKAKTDEAYAKNRRVEFILHE